MYKLYTVFTLSVRIPLLLSTLVPKIEQVQRTTCCCVYIMLDDWQTMYPASILRKSTSDRHRPVSYPDGLMTARYRFTLNADWVEPDETPRSAQAYLSEYLR